MKNSRIFCDAYGTYVINSECGKCSLNKNCIKIKLTLSKNNYIRSQIIL